MPTYGICQFVTGLKKFLELVLDNGIKTKSADRTRKSFDIMRKCKSLDVTELNEDYLLIIEKMAVAAWFSRSACLSYT